MAKLLDMFNQAGIVHSDLKPENVMMAVEGEDVRFKLIDLGSSFPFEAINDKVELTTPEYLPPEILDYLGNKAKLLDVEVIAQNPWSLDVWSFGCILLEMVTGFPLWLSYKGRIHQELEGNQILSSGCMTGLFGVQGRVPKKIIQKQLHIAANLKSILKK